MTEVRPLSSHAPSSKNLTKEPSPCQVFLIAEKNRPGRTVPVTHPGRGGLIMAANATDPEFTKEKENKLFVQLFGISALMLGIIVVAALIGLYSIL